MIRMPRRAAALTGASLLIIAGFGCGFATEPSATSVRVAGGFDRDESAEWVLDGKAAPNACGRKSLANPDPPLRFRLGADLKAGDTTPYYGGGMKGYTNYPSLEPERGEVSMPCVDERWR